MAEPQYFPIFLPNFGIKLDSPTQFLNRRWSPYSRNMERVNDVIQGRRGFEEFDTEVLSGPVLKIAQFWYENESFDLLFFTTKDIYKYDFGSSHYDFLTPGYNTGTVEVQSGTETILRGTGTSWDTSGLAAGDYVKLGAGSRDTDATWYEIQSVDNATQITTTSSMVVTAAGASYESRIIYAGATGDIWDGTEFFDTTSGNIYCATNGIDTPQFITEAATEFADFTALPTGLTTCKYIRSFFNKLVLLANVEGGQNLFFRVRWSEAGDFDNYDDLDFNDLDLPNAAHIIKGARVVGDEMIIPKDSKDGTGGAYTMRVSVSENDFDFSFDDSFEGNAAPFSIQKGDVGIIYFGNDNKFRKWNQTTDQEIFPEINPFFSDLSPNNTDKIFSHRVQYKDQIRWLLPWDTDESAQQVVVYDYVEKHAEIWSYKVATSSDVFRCIGEYLNVEDRFVDDPDWTDQFVDENEGFWDDREFLEDVPVILYGSENGVVYKADTTFQDNATDYTRAFRFARLDFDKPHMFKRLSKQRWWLTAQVAGSLTLKFRRDDNTAFDSATESISFASSTKDIVKVMVKPDKYFHACDLQLESTVHMGLVGVENFFHERRRTFV